MKKFEFLFPEGLRDFDKLQLEFEGYCGYHLTAHDRLLVPSVPEVGVLHHKGRYYGFMDSKAAEQFATNAEKYAVNKITKQSVYSHNSLYHNYLSCNTHWAFLR